jgi:type IV/VI secretion system ImpK/VasF family protein
MIDTNNEDHLHGDLMEAENYEMNIESWSTHLMQLEEESTSNPVEIVEQQLQSSAQTTLVPLQIQSYYRTKAFAATIGINNLINAADPLFMFVTKLRKITVAPDPSSLQQNLHHEIKAFEHKMQNLGYHTKIILAARHILCLFLEEMISKTSWGQSGYKFNLLNSSHSDDHQNDRFFLILDKSLTDAAGHLDILELIYVCLRFGYEGKYRDIEKGYPELRLATDNLYHTIREQRGEFSKSLYISIDETPHLRTSKKKYFHLLPSIGIISSAAIISVLTIFAILYLRLTNIASPVNHLLKNFSAQKIIVSENTATAKYSQQLGFQLGTAPRAIGTYVIYEDSEEGCNNAQNLKVKSIVG